MRQLFVAILFAGIFAILAGSACSDGLGRFTPPDVCKPYCGARECGTDGCGGSCGDCGGSRMCEPLSGLCMGGGDYNVTGSVDIEYWFGDVRDGSVAISGPEVIPVRDILLVVVDGDGDVIGADLVNGADGEFSVAVDSRPGGDEKLVITAVWAENGEVVMAVMDPSTADNDPGKGTFDPYTWVVDIPAGGSIGHISIGTEDHSGALFVYMMNKVAFESIVRPMADKNHDGKVVPLALFYGPWDEDFVPCTCYFGEKVTKIGTSDGPVLGAKISIVESLGDSSAWGWAVLFHEFGHYVLGAYSKDNSPGGMHYIGQTLMPAFAFSEGWASFMSLVTATLWFGEEWPVYWDIQGGSWFYVDFENGLYHGEDFGTAEMVFPKLGGSTIQKLDENWVARALYMIWDGSGTGAGPEESMTLDQMTDVVSSEFFLRGLEWSRDADLYNFLDSTLCLYPEKDPALRERVWNEFGYPYVGNPECTRYSAATIPIPAAGPVASAGPVSTAVPGAIPAEIPVAEPLIQADPPQVAVKRHIRDVAASTRVPIPSFMIHGVSIDSGYRVVPRDE